MRRCKVFGNPDSDKGIYDAVLEFDLSSVEPTLAGPKRPEQKTPLSKLPEFSGRCSRKRH